MIHNVIEDALHDEYSMNRKMFLGFILHYISFLLYSKKGTDCLVTHILQLRYKMFYFCYAAEYSAAGRAALLESGVGHTASNPLRGKERVVYACTCHFHNCKSSRFGLKLLWKTDHPCSVLRVYISPASMPIA